jgi:hypothetical protein
MTKKIKNKGNEIESIFETARLSKEEIFKKGKSNEKR